MIIRPQYMNTLKLYRDIPLVKILAGIRRCGKSTILDMLRDDLLKSGIAADHIINMRYTCLLYTSLLTLLRDKVNLQPYRLYLLSFTRYARERRYAKIDC